MKAGEGVSKYFTRVMSIANDMRNCGEDMSDVKIVEKILRSLTEKFNFVVCPIEESKDIDKLTYRWRMYQSMDKEEADGHLREEEVILEDGEEVDLL